MSGSVNTAITHFKEPPISPGSRHKHTSSSEATLGDNIYTWSGSERETQKPEEYETQSTVTLVGRGGREVEQLIQGVVVSLDGVDVLVVWVIGVHHHAQLPA